MLSDRIKKFGIKSQENNETGQASSLKEHENPKLSTSFKADGETAPENEDSKQVKKAAEDTTKTPQKTEALRRNMVKTLEKVTAEKSETVDLFVKTKLAEVDKKIASREKRTELNSGLSENTEKEKKQNDIPLLLKYSAALKNIEEENAADDSAGDSIHKNTDLELKKDDVLIGVTSEKSISEAEDNKENEEGSKNCKADEAMQASELSEISDITTNSGISVEKKEAQVFNFGWTGENNGKNEPDIADIDSGQHEAAEIEAEVVAKPIIVSKACKYAPALVAVISILILVMSKLSISSLERRDNIYLSFAVLQIIVLLIPAIFYSKLRRGNDISNLRLRGINPDKLYFTILTAFLLLFVSAAFKLLYIRLGIYDSRFAEYASYINIASFTSVSDIVYMIITFVLIPAVSEEFIFRSVVFGEYISDKFGYLSAAVISSVLYAFMQTSLTRLPVYFIIGMILAYVSVMTGSVIASMITSVVYGLLDVFTERYIVSLMNSDYRILLAFVVISLAFLFLTLFFAEAERLYYNRGTSGEPTPKRDERSESPRVLIWAAFSSPSFIVCFVIFIIGFLIKML